MEPKRKGIFFTSDLHFGHENVLRFDNRPFSNLEHMHTVLVNNYNSTVGTNDICYFLGDIGFCRNEEIRKYIYSLNGTKVLVLGNHDGGVNSMYGIGFDVVVNNLSLTIAGELVTASHFPLHGVFREKTEGMKGAESNEKWHGESREKLKDLMVQDKGQFHLHGHIHSPNGGKSQRVLGRQMDIGVVANNYRPVSISKIESWVSLTKQTEGALK